MSKLNKLFLCVLIALPVHAAQAFKFVNEFGGKGEGEAQFGKTLFMAFGQDGAIYIADTDNYRIQKFSESGTFVFDIRMDKGGEFQFITPTAIAVGANSAIYLMDWMMIPIPGTKNPTIFKYAPCIHNFDAQGQFVASYPLEEPSLRNTRQKQDYQPVVPGLDADGNYAIIMPDGDTKRAFLLTVDSDNNLYVYDNGLIYKLNPDGKQVARYPISHPVPGQVIHPSDFTVDEAGNLYILDEKGHRVLKYSTDGTFLLAFGEYGDAKGEFIAPFRIITLTDGTLLVADTAKYEKDFVSQLPQRLDAPRRFLNTDVRTFRYRLRRIQRFRRDGKCIQKLLIPFQREEEADASLQLMGIDTFGNLYYLNTTERKFRKYTQQTTLMSSLFQTELKLRYTRDLQDVEIDNQDDLDADLYTKADFDQKIVQDTMDAKLTVAYDINESLRIALSNRFAYIRMNDINYYRSQDFEDFRGTFNQDDSSTQTTWDNRIQLDFVWIRNHNIYSYREARLFAYFTTTRLDFSNDALNPRNFRFFDFTANLSDWGGGVYYDLSRTYRFNFEITHFFGANNYVSLDETNVLYATGFQEVDTTRAVFAVNGLF